MRKTVLNCARLMVDQSRRRKKRGRWAMLTATYGPDIEWSASQIRALLNNIREYVKRRGYVAQYVWVLELTKAGRPHYHVLLWLPDGQMLPKPDDQGWWPHGKTRIEWARRAVGYIAKYASKGMEQDQWAQLPKGARLSGNGGLDKSGRIEVRYWCMPMWVRHKWHTICDVIRIKGGYVNRDTGEYLASPYRCEYSGGVLMVYEVIL